VYTISQYYGHFLLLSSANQLSPIPELAIPACLGMKASVLKGIKAKVLGDCRVACGSSQCPAG